MASPRRYRWLAFGSVLLVFALIGTGIRGASAQELLSADQVKACFRCHEQPAATYSKGVHAAANCASCHTGSAQHLKESSHKPVSTGAEGCLACHGNDPKRANWAFAEHKQHGLQCSDCHSVHAPKALPYQHTLWRADRSSQLCASCHQSVASQLNLASHHPVREGALSCVSCHAPHGGDRVKLVDNTARCTSCHQRVRGPHAFEHPPVAEDCSTCHNPHGAPNRHLLQVAQPMTCLQCHSVAGNRHGQTGATNNTQRITAAMLRDCTSCHRQIHGSSQDQHLRY